MSKTIKLLLLTLCALIALSLLADRYGSRILEQELVKLFASGTGCDVQITNTNINLLTSEASAENVSISCEGGSDEDLLQIGKISTQIFLPALLTKQIILSHLSLKEVKAVSLSESSGLRALLGFIFGDESKSNEEKWHSGFSSGWRVKVQKVIIATDTSSSEPIKLSETTLLLKAHELKFSATDKGVEGYKFDLAIINFLIEDLQTKRIFKGDSLATSFYYHEQVIKLSSFNVIDFLNGNDKQEKLSVGGEISFEKLPAFAVNYVLTLAKEDLAALIGEEGNWQQAINSIDSSGEIAGDISEPVINGAVRVKLASDSEILSFKECYPTELTFHIQYSENILNIDQIDLDDLVSDGKIILTNTSDIPVEGKLDLRFSEQSPLLVSCVQALTKREDESAPSKLSQTIQDFLYDSSIKIKFSGKIDPLEIHANLSSSLSSSSYYEGSELNAELALERNTVGIKVAEQGSYPQLRKATDSKDKLTGDYQTPFGTEFNSILALNFNLNLLDNSWNMPKLELTRYPAKMALLRLAPFIKPNVLNTLQLLSDEQTQISLKANFNGAKSLQSGTIKGRVESIFLSKNDTADLNLNAVLKNDSFDVSEISLSNESGQINANGNLSLDGNIRLDVNAIDFSLSQMAFWRNYFPRLGDVSTLKAEIGGKLNSINYNGTIATQLFPLANKNNLTACKFEFKGDANQLNIDGKLFADTVTAQVEFPLGDNSSFAVPMIKLNAERMPLGMFLSNDTEQKTDFSQPPYITAAFDYRGKASSILKGDGSLLISSFVVEDGHDLLNNVTPVKLSVKSGRVDLGNINLENDAGALKLSGYIDNEEGWNASIAGSWELGTIPNISSKVAQMTGVSRATIKIVGPIEEPKINGSLSLEDGVLSLTIGNSWIEIDDLIIDAKFSNQDLKISQIEGKVGEGGLNATAKVENIFDSRSRTINLDYKLNEILVNPAPKFSVSLDGIGSFRKFGGDPAVLSGKLSINDAVYQDNIELTQLIKALTGSILGLGSGVTHSTSNQDLSSDVLLDLGISTSSPILVETNFTQAELGGNIDLSGSTNNPQAMGKISVINGAYGFQSSKFDILSGDVTFSHSQPINDPLLNIVGESLIKTLEGNEEQIRMTISGSVLHPAIDFISESGLRQNEIVALLGKDSTSADFSILSGTSSSHNVIELLDPRSDLRVQDRLTGLSGFSEVKVDTTFSATTGDLTPRVTAIRPLIGAVGLTVQSELLDNQANSATITYPLTNHIDLITGWKSTPVTKDVNTTSGSFNFGIRLQNRFSAGTLFPESFLGEQ